MHQRAVSLVLYEDVWCPDLLRDPVLAPDLADLLSVVLKAEPLVLEGLSVSVLCPGLYLPLVSEQQMCLKLQVLSFEVPDEVNVNAV